MPKELNKVEVNLQFTADTKQAKAQLEELQKSLKTLQVKDSSLLNLDQFKKASTVAKELSQHLTNATNTTTGKLDLSKFSKSLSVAHTDLNKIYQDLSSIGPEGQKSFLQLAQTISLADKSTFSLNKKFLELGTVLKNTAKWQFSSSLIHGLVGTVQTAYRYAQDLNESLNNIRIVTGQSVEQMDKFAERANRAAKALSASTLDYTNAALIYYQQGLTDEEVQKRTEVTVKMANVTGDTAEKVSQQLTAVWNNFAKGGQNLEYYADVMTALGAATASSSDEIAEGLSKFSAIADTVGLSYEYATAALATVTATTRQSADVVGNAFKTLFARMEGLKLGKTLDDGTDLNKYSQALASVGVNIKNASGELKGMDNILEELAATWSTLDKTQKTALAQTIGGVRQYNNLIALMDNWDFMQENLQVARGASGSLQDQANIYAESWEAATKRVQASFEKLYTQLIDDKAIISLVNGFDFILTQVGDLVEAFGGWKSILLLIGSIITSVYAKEIPSIIQRITEGIGVLNGEADKTRQKVITSLDPILEDMQKQYPELNKQISALESVNKLTSKLAQEEKNLSQEEINLYKGKIEQIKLYSQALVDIENKLNEINSQTKNLFSDSKLRALNMEDLRAQLAGTQETGTNLKAQRDSLLQQKQELEQRAEQLNQQSVNKQKEATSYWLSHVNNNNLTGAAKSAVTDKYNRLTGEANDAFKESNKSRIEALELNKQILEIEEKIRQNAQEERDIKTDIKKNDTSTFAGRMAVQKAVQQTSQELTKLERQYTTIFEIQNNTEDVDAKIIDRLVQEELLTEEQGNALKTNNVNYNDILNKLGLQIEKEEEKLRGYGIEEDKLVKFGQLQNEFVQGLLKELGLEEKIKSAEEVRLEHQRKMSEFIGQTISALSQCLMILNTWDSFMRNIKDDTKSWSERIKSGAMSLGMMVPSIAALTKGLPTMLATMQSIGGITAGIAGFLTTMPPLLVVIGGIAALGGTLWLVAKAFETIEASTPEGKLKAIKKTGEELKTQLDDTTQAVNDLKNSWNGIESAQEKLKELEHGTTEWKEALLEVNQQVLDLIVKFPELRKYLKFENGQYSISEDDYKEFLDSQLQNQRTLQAASLRNQVYQDQQQYEISILEARKKLQNKTSETISDEYFKGIAENQQNWLQAAEVGFTGLEPKDIAEYIATINSLGGYNRDFSSEFEDIDKSVAQNIMVDDENYQKSLSGLNSGAQNWINERVEESLTAAVTEATNEISREGIDIDTANQAYKNAFGKKADSDETAADWYYEDLIKNKTSTSSLNYGSFMAETIANSKILNSLADGSSKMTKTTVSDLRKELGFFNTSDEEIINLIAQTMSGQITDISSIQKDIAEGEKNKAFGKLEYGGKVGDAAFSLLDENLKTFFVTTEDGMHQLVGDAEEFQNILNQQHIDKYLDNVDALINKSFLYNNETGTFNGESWKQTQEISDNIQNAFMSAGSLTQLKAMQEQVQQNLANAPGFVKNYTNIDITDALLNMGTQYENATAEVEALRQFQQHSQEFYESSMQQGATVAEAHQAVKDKLDSLQNDLELAISAGEMAAEYNANVAKKFKIDLPTLEAHIKALKEDEKYSNLTTNALTQMAVKAERADVGIKAFTDNLADWKKVLNDSNGVTTEKIQVLQEMSEAIANIVGTTQDLSLSEKFIKDNMSTIEKAAKGSQEAILELGWAVNQFELKSLAGKFQGTEVETAANNVSTAIDQIRDSFTSLEDWNGIDLSTILKPEDLNNFISGMNTIAEATNMTVEEMNAKLASMGLSADVKVNFKEIESWKPLTVTRTELIPKTFAENGDAVLTYDTATYPEVVGYKKVPERIAYATINNNAKITGISPTAPSASATTPKKSRKGGGGGSSGNKNKKKERPERYHEVNRELEQIKEKYSEANTEADRLFGKDRIKKIEETTKGLKQHYDTLGKKIKEAKGYLEEDYTELMGPEVAGFIKDKLGIDILTNGIGGEILNYTDISKGLADLKNNLNRGNVKGINDKELEKLDDAVAFIKNYEDSVDTLRKAEIEQNEDLRQIQDNNNTILTYKIELRLQLREDDLQRIQNQINVLGDGLYKSAEVYSLMMSKWSQEPGVFDSTVVRDLTQDFQNFKEAFDAGKISQAQYMEGLRATMENVQQAIDDILSWSKEMEEYYQNTLQKQIDGLAGITDRIDHLNERLEHFKNIRSLAGMDQDYDVLDKILNGQLRAAKAQTDIAYQQRDLMKRELDAMQDEYNTLLKTDPERAQKFLDEQLRPTQEKFEEVENQLHEAQENQLEVATAVRDNLLDQAKLEAELVLTMGKGFDALNDSMDMSSKYQDEYLTKTNQIYETNKLLRDINNDIDKTDNQLAKNKLKNFADEIEGMKEQNQLSQLDLKIAQARYEQLQAQIALEEAQNAKSIVRLQRDNEGNYGYVYTADQDKVGDAEQDLANKTNDLYNLVLENSNNYAQKMVELRQSTLEQLAELDTNAADYEARKKEIMDNAAKLYQSYADQYGTAMYWLGETAATDTFEAWTTQFIEPATYSVDSFTNTMNDYMGQTDQAVSQFKDNISDVTGIEEALDDVEQNVEDVETAIDKLQNEAEDYIDTSSGVIEAVRDQTIEYYNMYDAIQAVIQGLMDLKDAAGAEIASQAGKYDNVSDYTVAIARSMIAGNLGDVTGYSGGRNIKTSSRPGHYNTGEKWVAEDLKNELMRQGLTAAEADALIEKDRRYFAQGYASGGYTGSWGSEGKLALLHEKELVLNADDTKNFLQGVQILRQITSAIDLRAAVSSNASSSILPSFGGGAQTLEQQVTITAEFPNATNHTEIEEAFNNLINRASQYANRYR